jgi:hypothetical protein
MRALDGACEQVPARCCRRRVGVPKVSLFDSRQHGQKFPRGFRHGNNPALAILAQEDAAPLRDRRRRPPIHVLCCK